MVLILHFHSLADQFFQFGELAIRRGIPRLGQLEHGEEALGIEPQVSGELRDEEIGPQPVEVLFVVVVEQSVAVGGLGGKAGEVFRHTRNLICLIARGAAGEKTAVVPIIGTCLE